MLPRTADPEAIWSDYIAARAALARAKAQAAAARRALAAVDAALAALRTKHAAHVTGADEDERAARLLLAVRADPAYPQAAAQARDAESDLAAAEAAIRRETARLLAAALAVQPDPRTTEGHRV
jgi:hypothetical protein